MVSAEHVLLLLYHDRSMHSASANGVQNRLLNIDVRILLHRYGTY